MNELYEFLTGPALWATFLIFVGGLIVRTAFLFGLSRERDLVVYNHVGWKWGLKSIIYWLIPLGSVSWRTQPLFAISSFVFHLSLLAVPVFLLAHNTLWQEAFGMSLWSMPDSLADIMTILLVVAGAVLFLRRLVKPEVRILSTAWDYTVLALTVLPFLTGFFAYHQVGPYRLMLILHVLSAEVLLIVVPFSKLGHIVLFFFSRAYIGFEMGQRRGARTW